MISNTNILLRHNYIAVPSSDKTANHMALATVMMNISYFGYALSAEAYGAISKLDNQEMTSWWKEVETELKSITGDDRKIGDFVVYKNFPAEVLDKTEAEYWIPQILMYWGFPNEFFTEPVQPRARMSEQPRAIVLKKSKKDSLKDILTSYLKSPARWKEQELQDVLFLSEQFPVNLVHLAFKENLIRLVSFMMANGKKANLNTATDVLRLAVGLSNGDVSLREKSRLKSFKKSERRFILSMLESCTNLTEDVARRPELFKRLLHQLHPGDYKRQFPRVCQVTDDLYKDRLETFNSKVEQFLQREDVEALSLLSSRPGDFRRRLVHTLDLFGNKAVKAFTNKQVLDKLTTAQIVTLRAYLESANFRAQRVFPPKGNWSKLQLGEAREIEEKHVRKISDALGQVLSSRLPKVKFLDVATTMVKLPSNDGEVSPYARGTVFPIPKEVEFIRTASYWADKGSRGQYNTWFDNGWNFFNADWKSLGACCWRRETNYKNGAAIFSGDPTNSKDMEGRAAQLIDLYPAKLLERGVRYAVWNILCFSSIPFCDANDVFAALQWGKDAQTGKLFEPSRCQLQFPLTGKSLTKYICLLDLKTREMTYLDANLKGNTSGADLNGSVLEKTMPAFLEYINSLPSVHDLFRGSVDKTGDIHVLYSDKDVGLKDVQAYVFKPENKDNKYKPVDLNNLLT